MRTLIDLDESSQLQTNATCDVCVIGAGAAGLYLASRLARDRLSVVVVEAGGVPCQSGSSVHMEALLTGNQYRGALDGRAFGWGGTTSKWGGLLVPYSELDLRDDGSPDSSAWKHIVDVVKDRSNAVFSALGLQGSAGFFPLSEGVPEKHANLLHDRGLKTIAAEALPFRRRNLTYLASGQIGRNLTVYLNAVASGWVVNPSRPDSGAVVSVEASSRNGRTLHVSANSFVIAAGAIESARILLEIDQSTAERMFPRSAKIGFYLSDHLSCAIADVHPDDREKAATMFGPLFSKGRMRSLRFIAPSLEPSMPRHFAHFIFDIDNPAFRFAKTLLCKLQARTSPDFRISNVIDAFSGLSRLAYNRFVCSRLFIPPRTPSHLQLDIEQTPSPANRVHLGEQLDRFGRPVAVVHWEVTQPDHKNIEVLSQRLLSKWSHHSAELPRLLPLNIDHVRAKSYDAYHPVGTCRMGADGHAAVDFGLRVKGTENLYVLSTGVFPSAGTANPTFSMLCLGEMLAESLVSRSSRSTSVH